MRGNRVFFENSGRGGKTGPTGENRGVSQGESASPALDSPLGRCPLQAAPGGRPNCPLRQALNFEKELRLPFEFQKDLEPQVFIPKGTRPMKQRWSFWKGWAECALGDRQGRIHASWLLPECSTQQPLATCVCLNLVKIQ